MYALSTMKKILIVDDEIQIHESLKLLLMGYDAEFDSAFNGREALDKLEAGEHYDLILLDWSMPIMDGGTFMEYMTSKSFIHPVVVCSALACLVTNVKDKYTNIIGIVPKPFDYQELTTLIDQNTDL